MASVSSLDKDLRKMRLEKYTPAAANEARSWIEGVLGERLPGNDLLEGLKSGVALCKLINLAVGPPGVKFKQSAMPFVQMENISHFLRVCQMPPLDLKQHDVFLTVDLYEQKDPTQVLQCLGAFSRAAQKANPSVFPTAIGASKPGKGSVLSPQSTGPGSGSGIAPGRNRGFSNASNGSSTPLVSSKTGDSGSGRWSPTKSPTGSDRVGSPTVSSWSNKTHEGVTSPAWNIAQYGYMGGASQGNLGVAFGGRRQITSASPHVPNLADKERRRKELEAESERQRQQMEEEEQKRKAEMAAEEDRARLAQERQWEDESRKLRAEEKRRAEEEKRRWEEEERQWKLTEEKRRRDEEEAEAKLDEERRATRSRSKSNTTLDRGTGQPMSDGDRIRDLERQLELARQREQQYEEERERRAGNRLDPKSRARSRSRARPTSRPGSRPTSRPPSRPPSRQESFARGEREVLKTQWDRHQEEMAANPNPPTPGPALPARPLPVPTPTPLKKQRTGEKPPVPLKPQQTGGEGRPLPVPAPAKKQPVGGPLASPPPQKVTSPVTPSSNSRPLPQPKSRSPFANRTDRYLANHQAPLTPPPQQTYSRELGATAEQDSEDRRRQQAQQKTKAAGWASKSLLEREMEMERQRQREWEESQKETAQAVRAGDGVDGIGGGIGGKWDVNQWTGFTGGDSQNKGGAGIGAGRRQIVGPRPLPGRP
ncbi:hypothetical protein PG993_008133 [Apiospora rasikravindrae]|uniref:Calponin-homology (CH) domain-containing protein n=1 Tax=Apiospora rasikravindrae TaxID=990691 RepID=A0ABR1SZG8_9PEZI